LQYGDFPTDFEPEYFGQVKRLVDSLERTLVKNTDPRIIFAEFTRALQREYDIKKGFLALKEGSRTRLLAVATWNRGQARKNLSLRLPSSSSLFDKVTEDGRIYTESFAELFDGNMIERRLLIDDDTQSFMLRPLIFDGHVVALLGYSSDSPHAFVTFEEGQLDPLIDRLAEAIARFQLERSHP
jgi:GAF domain-containing protein